MKESGLSRSLLEQAIDLQNGNYRAEALTGLCTSRDMQEDERSEWVPIIIDSMLEEERGWRVAECIGTIVKSVSNWPKGRSSKSLMEGLISITGGLPAGEARIDALKSISSKVPATKLPELLFLAIENQGMEMKATRPVLKAMVATGNQNMIQDIIPLLLEATPDLAAKFLSSLHHLISQSKISIEPTPLQLALPLLTSANFETVRNICSQANTIEDVRILFQTLKGTNEDAIRYTMTLAGRADRAGDTEFARQLLEHAATHVEGLEEDTTSRIKRNLAKGFARIGDEKRAEALSPAPSVYVQESSGEDVGALRNGHTMALVGTYDGAIGTAHLRALARASGIAWGFGVDIALVGWPTEDLAGLCERAQKESGAAGVNHLPALLESNRIQMISESDALNGVVGHPVATTHQPSRESVDLHALEGNLCLLVGMGRQGLPKRILDICEDQFELTGVGASLETAVAMGAIAQRLSSL